MPLSALRSLTLEVFGKYYRHKHFDRLKHYKVDGQMIELIMCYYCDDMASERDHVYPVSALTRDALAGRIPRKAPLLIVPACRTCNRALHDRVFKSLRARRAYIRRLIKAGKLKRYYGV